MELRESEGASLPETGFSADSWANSSRAARKKTIEKILSLIVFYPFRNIPVK
jgi:hypothetical protein